MFILSGPFYYVKPFWLLQASSHACIKQQSHICIKVIKTSFRRHKRVFLLILCVVQSYLCVRGLGQTEWASVLLQETCELWHWPHCYRNLTTICRSEVKLSHSVYSLSFPLLWGLLRHTAVWLLVITEELCLLPLQETFFVISVPPNFRSRSQNQQKFGNIHKL